MLGMWHSMQPVEEFTGQARLDPTLAAWHGQTIGFIADGRLVGVGVRVMASGAIQLAAALGYNIGCVTT